MSFEAFTTYAATRGFTVREEFSPALDYEEDDGTITHYEATLHRVAGKSDGEVVAWCDVSDAALDRGEWAWRILLDLADEEFARQRERLSSAPAA